MTAQTEPAHRTGTAVGGIVLAALSLSLSLAVMPVLSAAQRRAGREIGSASAVADSRQGLLCTCLSAVLLAGLLANLLFGLVVGRSGSRAGHRCGRGEGRPRRVARGRLLCGSRRLPGRGDGFMRLPTGRARVAGCDVAVPLGSPIGEAGSQLGKDLGADAGDAVLGSVRVTGQPPLGFGSRVRHVRHDGGDMLHRCVGQAGDFNRILTEQRGRRT
jgi:hypothetical protein